MRISIVINMVDIRGKISEIYSLEQLSAGDTVIHNLHPFSKIVGTVVYILCVVSSDRYQLTQLVSHIFYPIIVLSLAEIPCKFIAKRTLIALPFCLFAGASNLFFDRAIMLRIGDIAISGGVLSFCTILFRTVACVAAVLILVAVTPFTELTGQLRRFHIPDLFISLFEMTYRYIGSLLEEASSMYTAYRLRSCNKNAIEMKHMGSFIGQLLIRSFDRAERVYHAMKCRGYGQTLSYTKARPLNKSDTCFLIIVCGSSILFRFVNLPLLLGRFF